MHLGFFIRQNLVNLTILRLVHLSVYLCVCFKMLCAFIVAGLNVSVSGTRGRGVGKEGALAGCQASSAECLALPTNM